jgi:hypothetical protein
MKSYSNVEIESLIERFEASVLPKIEWTHEAHLVVAIWYSLKHEHEPALDLVREFITKHNESVGTVNDDFGGYHETITKFWMLIARSFLKDKEMRSIDLNCNDFINSEFGKSEFPLNFYSKELIFSILARQYWVEPDKLKIQDFHRKN